MTINKYGIIHEASRAEGFEVADVSLNMEVAEIERILESIDELDNDINYTAEMVNIVRESVEGESYCTVNFDDVQRYMESAGIEDITEALNNIAEANDEYGVTLESMCVVIESEDTILYALNEAKKARKVTPGKMKRIKNTADVLAMMVTKGIKVAKRKSKSGKKGKRKSKK